MIKKHILGLSIFILLLSVGFSTKVEAIGKVYLCSYGSSIPSQGLCCGYASAIGTSWYSSSSAEGKALCNRLTVRPPVPVTITEPIMSPVPKISPSYSSLQNKYTFAPYALPQILNTQTQLPQTTIPVNDPITVSRVNPLLNSNPLYSNVPNSQNIATVGVDLDGTVQSKFNLGVTDPIIWPPKSIFDNIGFWNQPFADTFKAFVSGTPGTNSKYYPLNFFSIANPTSKIPLIPVTINWNAAPKTPETPTSYKFKLSVFDGLPGLDTNLPIPIDINKNSNDRSYTFNGRGMVSYLWSATPLRANGTEIIGNPIIKNPIKTYVQENINIPGTPYYTWGWDEIPGAVRYEIRYALSYGGIPYSVPFTDGATFTETSISNYLGYPGSPVVETVQVLSSTLNGTPGLNYNNDLDPETPGFQYDFVNSLLSTVQDNLGQIHHVLHWQIRGIDASGNVVRDDVVQGGIVTPPLPVTPYQSGYPTWSKVPGATNYLIDVVEDPADFEKLPILDGVQSATATKGGTTVTSPPVTADNTFLLRRVVPEVSYNASSSGKIVVSKFTSLLKEARVYQGEINQSSGEYDYLYSQDSSFDWGGEFDNTAALIGSSPVYMDDYYPLVTNDLGMTISSPSSNQLKLVTSTKINVIDKSTGNAKITITHTADKKTTTLTFGVKSNTGTGGSYAFDIVKLVSSGTVVYPLTYNTFGPMPVIENLTGKGYTEFTKLLPGTTYSYRVRGFYDSNPLVSNTNPLANPFTWYPWSAVKTFTTLTGVPDSVTVDVDGSEIISPFELQGVIPKASIKNTTVSQKSMTLSGNGSKSFSWAPITGATSYSLKIKDSKNNIVQTIDNVKGTTYTASGLKVGENFSYTLQSVNAFGKSVESNAYPFVAEIPKVDLNSDKNLKAKIAYQKALMIEYKNLASLKSAAYIAADNIIKSSDVSLKIAVKAYKALAKPVAR